MHESLFIARPPSDLMASDICVLLVHLLRHGLQTHTPESAVLHSCLHRQHDRSLLMNMVHDTMPSQHLCMLVHVELKSTLATNEPPLVHQFVWLIHMKKIRSEACLLHHELGLTPAFQTPRSWITATAREPSLSALKPSPSRLMSIVANVPILYTRKRALLLAPCADRTTTMMGLHDHLHQDSMMHRGSMCLAPLAFARKLRAFWSIQFVLGVCTLTRMQDGQCRHHLLRGANRLCLMRKAMGDDMRRLCHDTLMRWSR